jgi:hypothetical protein
MSRCNSYVPIRPPTRIQRTTTLQGKNIIHLSQSRPNRPRRERAGQHQFLAGKAGKRRAWCGDSPTAGPPHLALFTSASSYSSEHLGTSAAEERQGRQQSTTGTMDDRRWGEPGTRERGRGNRGRALPQARDEPHLFTGASSLFFCLGMLWCIGCWLEGGREPASYGVTCYLHVTWSASGGQVGRRRVRGMEVDAWKRNLLCCLSRFLYLVWFSFG